MGDSIPPRSRISLGDQPWEGNLRRAHLLAPENQLAQLETDLAVVDNERDLACSQENTVSHFHSQKHPFPSSSSRFIASSLRHHLFPEGETRGDNIRSTKPITLPVRPPTLPRALDRPLAAPVIAGPAAEVTRDRPSVALDLYSAAEFLAASAVFCAVDDAVLSKRRAATVRRGRTACRRRRGRAMADEDILLLLRWWWWW